MNSEYQLTQEIKILSDQYHDASDKLAGPDLRKMSDELKDLKKELSDVLSKGANKCPFCDSVPHGMRRNPGAIEVGCLVCPPHIVDHEDGSQTRISISAQGITSEEAVKNWNAGKWIEQTIPKPVTV